MYHYEVTAFGVNTSQVIVAYYKDRPDGGTPSINEIFWDIPGVCGEPYQFGDELERALKAYCERRRQCLLGK